MEHVGFGKRNLIFKIVKSKLKRSRKDIALQITILATKYWVFAS
ncbi:4442_t:CDS:2 [Ambispora leptoticha]|uniref:4442_t:CDS:1 n=1 Tax=Ambispora leptoticha TaxID=144679 RepID=A0A9N9EZD5_9GLOM|nr:4442_t:CDS:2 [Ambispora leptoticha]